MYYKSMSSESHYIKVDCGVAHSIRISDHRGKGHLAYKYFINTKAKKKYFMYQSPNTEHPTHVFAPSNIDTCIRMILTNRRLIKAKHGPHYNQLVQKQADYMSKHKKLRMFKEITNEVLLSNS